jgi:hypothetical protein
VRGRDYIRLKRWRSCKRLFAEATTTPTCLGIGEWVRSNPLRAIFVLVRLPKQGRQAKTAAGKRARSKKSKQAARSAREPQRLHSKKMRLSQVAQMDLSSFWKMAWIATGLD